MLCRVGKQIRHAGKAMVDLPNTAGHNEKSEDQIEKGHGEALPASPWPINAGTMAPIVPPSQSMV